MNIYLASSGRNEYHDSVLKSLRDASHVVFNYRKPAPGINCFSWSDIPEPEPSNIFSKYEQYLRHHKALQAFAIDYTALRSCDALVLVLPSGASSHLELGVAIGLGKHTIIRLNPGYECPELMYIAAHHIVNCNSELISVLADIQLAPESQTKPITPLSRAAFIGQ